MTAAVIPLFEDVLKGERLALARLLTLVENDTATGRAALDYLFPHTGRAHLVGITGSPGTGKSSLVNQIVKGFRAAGAQKVAVIAVDPSSPFTGGALLGDRVRMRDLAGDPGVFVRSMASRGALGGLSHTTAAAAQVMDAAGFDVVLIETVGAGQSEIDIARLAHTVLVVEAPGLGDDIQANKAGILEIADILVVNKSDLPGAERAVNALRAMLEMAHPTKPGWVSQTSFWMPPVLMTHSTGCEPLTGVIDAIQNHKAFLLESGEWRQRERERLKTNLNALIQDMLMLRFHENLPDGKYEDVINQIVSRELSPYEAVNAILGLND